MNADVAPRAERQPGVVVATVVGTAAVLTSSWVHFYLYFRGGYRGIAPESVLGLTISRSFVVQAVAGVVVAEALVLGLRFRSLLLPASVLGIGFGVATLVAYALSRTSGFLGFQESTTTTEALLATVVEAVAIVALVPVAVTELRARRRRAR
jgi:hypothetical protein